MVARQAIQEICQTIVDAFHPLKVILFGSHAYGTPSPDSDVDLLVIMPFEGSPMRKAAEVSLRIPHCLPIDVLVRTPEFVAERVAMGDCFMREIVERGRVLYEAADAGVGRKG
jgi:predicted nucleotidyltransferase